MVPRQRGPVDDCQARKVTACAELIHRQGPNHSSMGIVYSHRFQGSARQAASFRARPGIREEAPNQSFCGVDAAVKVVAWAADGVPMGRIGSLGATQLSEPAPRLFRADLVTGCSVAGHRSSVPFLVEYLSPWVRTKKSTRPARCAVGRARHAGSETDDPRCQRRRGRAVWGISEKDNGSHLFVWTH